MMDYVLDVCLSLAYHGFKKILMVNGHGSNVPVLDLVARRTIIATKGQTACAAIFYMHSAEYQQAATRLFPESDGTGHGDAIETSLYMGLRPELVQLEKAHDDPSTGLMELGTACLPLRLIWSSFSKEGIFGTVAGANRTKGEQLLAAAVEGLAKVFVQFYEKEIPPRVDHH
jgi:creatinine amidohydrolase